MGSLTFFRIKNGITNPDDIIRDRDWGKMGVGLGLQDTANFSRCISDNDVAPLVRSDSLAAELTKIRSAPAIVIGDSVFSYGLELDELKAKIGKRGALRR